jgi:hypothetical protein
MGIRLDFGARGAAGFNRLVEIPQRKVHTEVGLTI